MYVVTLQSKRERGQDSTPPTPSKTLKEKKAKPNTESGHPQASNNDILEAILELGKRVTGIESQLGDIKEQNRQNTAMIVSLTKTVQFNSEELKEVKNKVLEVERANSHLLEENKELKKKVMEQKRYSMRPCLRVRGLKEKKDENLRATIIPILKKIAPEYATDMERAVDVVHRLGKREDNRTRQVIILFALRHVKDEVWLKTKDSPICRMEGISFAEMLPKEDLEAQERLWPLVDQARKAGKRAFFRGPYAYIDGGRVEDNGLQTSSG
ncbi:hypothetical protein PO909_024715 [Leuciscus waleckii]